MEQNNTSLGQVKISTDVITTIATVAVNDSQFNDLSIKKGRNVSVHYEEDQIVVDVDLISKYGAKLPVLGTKMQEKVKTSVENMTGLPVKSVNINVTGMNIEKAAKEA